MNKKFSANYFKHILTHSLEYIERDSLINIRPFIGKAILIIMFL